MFFLLCLFGFLGSSLAQEVEKIKNIPDMFTDVNICYFGPPFGTHTDYKEIAEKILNYYVHSSHIIDHPFFNNRTYLLQLDPDRTNKILTLWRHITNPTGKTLLLTNKSWHNLTKKYLPNIYQYFEKKLKEELKQEYVSFDDAKYFFPHYDVTIKFDLPYHESQTLFGHKNTKREEKIIPLYATCSVIHFLCNSFLGKVDNKGYIRRPDVGPTNLHLTIGMYVDPKNKNFDFEVDKESAHNYFFTNDLYTMEQLKETNKAVAPLNNHNSTLFEQYRKLITPLMQKQFFGDHCTLYEFSSCDHIALIYTFGRVKTPCIADLPPQWHKDLLQFVPASYQSKSNLLACPLDELSITLDPVEGHIVPTETLVCAYAPDVSLFHIYKILKFMLTFYNHPLCIDNRINTRE
jgi:hypothetical protein